jgi:uncharacterized protein (DUF1778 family)
MTERTEVIRLKVTPDELAAIERVATRLGVTTWEYVLDVVLEDTDIMEELES